MHLHIQTALINTLYELGFEKTLWAFSEETDYGLGLEVGGTGIHKMCFPTEPLIG